MKRPIRHTLLAAMLFAPLGYGTRAQGIIVDLMRFGFVFFGVCFALLLWLSFFGKRIVLRTPVLELNRNYTPAAVGELRHRGIGRQLAA